MSIHTESPQPLSADLVLEPADNERLANLCGPLDEHLRQVERRLGVEINNRGNNFHVSGDQKSIELTENILKEMDMVTLKLGLNCNPDGLNS